MTAQLLTSAVRLSIPLLFAAMGGLLSERAGVINIALEGLMLVGAFGAAVVTFYAHSPWLGALAGILSGMLLAAFYGLFAIRWRANQIVAGTGINMLAFGVTPFLCKIFFDVTGSTPAIPLAERFQYAPFWLCWLAVAGCYVLLRFTRPGLRLSFAGEKPQALLAAGISVTRVRWMAVLASGALAGLGGASLSICLASFFSRNMTAGRGFIALAALIFGKWKPIPAALACVLFGLAEAAEIRWQGATIGGVTIPVQLIQILPYVLTMLVLAGFVGRARVPASLGIPSERR